MGINKSNHTGSDTRITMAEDKLLEGVRFFDKKENQPDFVIGSGVITLDDIYAFSKANPELITEYQGKKQIKFQLLKSKAGNLYAKVDTWKPDATAAPAGNMAAPELPDTELLPF